MRRSLAERWRRLRHDPDLRSWLSAGLTGALSGGAGVAWLFWGWPNLARDGACFLFWLALGAGMFALACGTGVSFVILLQWLLKAVRRLRTPPAYAMWEPVEPVPELDMGLFAHPGCAIALYLPLILISGAFSVLVIYLGARQVAAWRVALMVLLGLPFSIAMARAEGRRRS